MNTIRCEYQPEERAIVLPAHFKRDEGQALEVYGMPFDDGQKVREILPDKVLDFFKRFFGSPLDFRVAENGGGFDVCDRL